MVILYLFLNYQLYTLIPNSNFCYLVFVFSVQKDIQLARRISGRRMW